MKIRKWVARTLVKLAQKIEPESPEVKEFYHRQMMDLLITGGSIMHIDPMDIYQEQPVGK